MIARWPGSCLHAVSGVKNTPNAPIRVALCASHRSTTSTPHTLACQYAQQQQPRFQRPDEATKRAIAEQFSAKAAVTAVESGASIDPVNPPRSTRPPPLALPERSESQTVFIYLWNTGRAYGTFYKEAVKAVWFNNRAAQIVRDRITKGKQVKTALEAATKGLITRSEWQILQRNRHDIGKLPVFGLMVLLFGEWLPLLVPFIPGAVPGTARIPKQIIGMRMKAEERRRRSFREGIAEPGKDQLPDNRVEVAGRPGGHADWPVVETEYLKSTVGMLRADQLLHLSTCLGLHSNIWDRIQLYPPSFVIKHRVGQRMQYLALDDKLLLKSGGASRLSFEELQIACEERGLDILGKKEAALRGSMAFWLKCQGDDNGRGRAMLTMLFRRLAIRDWVTLNLEADRD